MYPVSNISNRTPLYHFMAKENLDSWANQRAISANREQRMTRRGERNRSGLLRSANSFFWVIKDALWPHAAFMVNPERVYFFDESLPGNDPLGMRNFATCFSFLICMKRNIVGYTRHNSSMIDIHHSKIIRSAMTFIYQAINFFLSKRLTTTFHFLSTFCRSRK